MRMLRHIALPLILALTLTFALALTGALATSALAVPRPYLDLPGAELQALPEDDSLRIVINVPVRRLHVVEGPYLVASYPVAVGRAATPTPRGSFRILQMAKDPTWAPKGGPVVPPGPANPLGTRWMRITDDGYGIHATNDPASIGSARSHGCVRMLPADAESLFAQVQRGTRVDIIDDPEGWAVPVP